MPPFKGAVFLYDSLSSCVVPDRAREATDPTVVFFSLVQHFMPLREAVDCVGYNNAQV
jgi:hypothetical protein